MIDTDVLPEMAVDPWKGPGVVLFESVPERDLSNLSNAARQPVSSSSTMPFRS